MKWGNIKESILSYFLVIIVPPLLVCQQDYTKNTELIFSKLGWRIGLCLE